ncbi:MAG: hypothetical protein ABSC72_13190 [Methylovirgula sp.]|jgi:hypothetical protein
MSKAAPEKVPKALDAMADVVLAYKPKAKSEPAKKRKKKAKKLAKASFAQTKNENQDSGNNKKRRSKKVDELG